MASVQAEEVASIKATFQDEIKVLSDIGEFTKVVTFQPKDLDLQCKFQLLGDYPDSIPNIIILSQLIDEEQTHRMVTELQTQAKSKLGSAMLSHLIRQAMDFIADLGIDLSLPTTNPKSKAGAQKQKHRKKKPPKSEKEAEPKGKKPPMKTAAEVIKRLEWDEAVDKEEFIVGYMDRLTGLEERPFTDFTWEDLATVDQFCLAIPQHRIQYFKYHDLKVWDKNERLDDVFGSTGSNQTLPETIKRYHTQDKQATPATSDVDGEVQGLSDNKEFEYKKPNEEETGERKTHGADNAVGQERTGKRTEEPQTDAKSKHKFNYFVAFRITNKHLVAELTKLQAAVLELNPDFGPYGIHPSCFHLTLDVLRLDSEAEVTNCVAAMKKMQRDFLTLLKQADELSFEGVDHFSNRVIYSNIKFNKAFLELVDTIKYNLTAANVRNECKSSFTPHLTLFKMSMKHHFEWRKLGKHVVFPKWEKKLGNQSVDNILICEMGTATDNGEFYQSIYEYKLSDFDFEL